MSASPQTPHGYDLEPDLARALRGTPPAHALSWLCSELGARQIAAVHPLDGGTSSAVHRVVLESRTGSRLSVIMRRYVLDWLAEEPWTPSNEATVLRLLNGSAVPAPQLLAADPDGTSAGAPTIVMSVLPGRVDWRPHDLDSWLRQLAEALPAVHDLPITTGLRKFEPYAPEKHLPPKWSAFPAAWERAIELYHGPQPQVPQVFIHRDYHPGNVLWSSGGISGIVDWPSACLGGAGADVGHCRANIIRHFGLDAADRFLRIWQSASGTADYHPYWDLTDVISWSGDEERPDPELDAFVAAAVARL